MWVYCITNSANGKKYVGMTTRSVCLRFAEHLRQAKTDKYKIGLHGAIKKYGESCFSVECIYEASNYEELCEAEDRFIVELGTISPNGYNLKSGGVDGFYSEDVLCEMSRKRTGVSPSPETRKKLSDAHKKIPRTEKQLDALRLSRVGNKHCLGRVMPQEHKDKISIANTGKIRSESTRRLLSRINSGENHPQADKTIYKIINDDGRVFVGTRVEFSKLLGARNNCLWGKSPRKQHKGWRIAKP